MFKSFLITFLCVCGVSVVFAQTRTVGRLQYAEGTMEGYTFFGVGATAYQYLLDNCGEVVHRWEGTNRISHNAFLLEDGRMVRMTTDYLEIVNWNGTLDFAYDYPDGWFHHDLYLMPNGHILVMVGEFRTYAECIAAGRDPDLLIEGELVEEKIIELDPTNGGRIVWEWSLWDHMVQDFDPTKDNFGSIDQHLELLDLNFSKDSDPDFFHPNGIDYSPGLDQIMYCSRYTHEFYIIDHSTTTAQAASHSGGASGKGGDFLYRWGNPQLYGAGGPDDQQLFGPHDAHWVPDSLVEAGNVMVFNNGWLRDTLYSEVILLEMDGGSSGGTYQLGVSGRFGPSEAYWSYTSPRKTDFYSPIVSGAQWLPNGNLLICSGTGGHLIEINEDKETVWEYINPHTFFGPVAQGEIPGNHFVFQAVKYPTSHPAFIGKNLEPQGPIELDPFPDTCIVTYLPPPLPDPKITFYPNPTSTNLIITYPYQQFNDALDFEVVNALGQVVFHASSASTGVMEIDLTRFESGIYLVNLSSGRFSLSKKVLKLE